MHARLDLLSAALDGPPAASGTTNVDFNEPMRAALAGPARAGGPLRLHVGADEVAVTTVTASVVERKVPLPDRWVKGFGEVQALARRMRPVAELAGAHALRFVTGIPRSLRHPLWAVPAGPTLTLATSPRPGAACLAGSHRLAELGPLLRFARALRVYAPEADTRSLHAYQQSLAPLAFEPVIWRPGPYSALPGPAPLARVTAPPAGPAGSRCWALLTALSDPGRDFYRDHAYRHFMGPGYRPVVAGWPAPCPWQPELAAAHLLRPLSDSLKPGSGRAGTAAAALGGLSPSGHALGEIGHLAVVPAWCRPNPTCGSPPPRSG